MTDWLIGFSGIIIGAVLGWIGSLIILKKREFYKASSKFRESFVDELLFLESPINKTILQE